MEAFKAADIAGLPDDMSWPEDASEMQLKWGQVCKEVLKYEADFDALPDLRERFGWNRRPAFPQHLFGDIQQADKPYRIANTVGNAAEGVVDDRVEIDGTLIAGAKPRAGRTVACLIPEFPNAAQLTGHYEGHVDPGAPGKSVFPTGTFGSEAEYEAGAQSLLRGYSGLETKFSGYVGAGPNRTYVYDRQLRELAVMGSTGHIATYHPYTEVQWDRLVP